MVLFTWDSEPGSVNCWLQGCVDYRAVLPVRRGKGQLKESILSVSLLIVATLFCLQHPRAVHSSCSDQLLLAAAVWKTMSSYSYHHSLLHSCSVSSNFLCYREMSRHRISVEWGIGRCKQLFQMMTNKVLELSTDVNWCTDISVLAISIFQNNLNCLMSPVAAYWFNSIFFTNLHTCINRCTKMCEFTIYFILLLSRRCQVSDYFDLEPPTLMEYINSWRTSL